LKLHVVLAIGAAYLVLFMSASVEI